MVVRYFEMFQRHSQGTVRFSSEYGFGCSVSTIGRDIAGVVVVFGENCDLMYGSEVWNIVQGAYAQYALVPCSNDAHPFLISFREGWHDPLPWKGQLAVFAEAGALGPRNPRLS